ncbi:MAG: pilin [Patescibacteria group bacterium]|nr:pilin [Patescibacteria group bacterium]
MKRKIIISVFKILFIASILFYFASVKNAYADFPCGISPSTVSPNANVAIDGGGNFSGTKKFYVSVSGTKVGGVVSRVGSRTGTLYSPINGIITFKLPSTYTSGVLPIGVYMEENSGTNLCNNNPTIAVSGPSGSGGGNNCNLIPVKPSPFTPKPSDYISFKITGNLASGNGDDQLHTYIRVNNNGGAGIWDGCIKRSALTDSGGFGFGYLTSSTYYIQVNDGCTPLHLLENQACYATFRVDPAGGGLGGSGNPQNPIPPGPCSNGANKNGVCTQVDTGLGIPIGTNPQSLIRSIFGLILSISGGIALLLIIISGYRVLASQGNPEALKGAREQLTAAIVGLLFIIFALVILQIIGYDILRIPGFK